jgi:diguanylate cyclase (GGDEF)-like protein
VDALHFDPPDIKTENEVESLSHAITRMAEDMQDYVCDILSAEKEKQDMKELADEMSELANSDALTGLRNKTAFDREVAQLDSALAGDPELSFGFAMIDLNYLKKINDTYGHTKGDAAIRRLSGMVCDVFSHSPVFRIGGDEFVVILRGQDYRNAEVLKERFIAQLARNEHNVTLQPWHRVSAAIGIATYDRETDENAKSVFKRADRAMYEMKKEMKAERLI